MSHRIPRILCIGKTTQDVFLSGKIFRAHREGKAAFEHLPLGEKLAVDDATFTTGGNAGNVAVTLARAGLHASYMWALGTDVASHRILQDLDSEAVDTSLVIQDDKYQAAYSTILLAPNGERTVLNYKGVTVGHSGRPLELNAIADADWVYPTSLATGGLELLVHIIDIARKANVKIMLNPAGSELVHPAKLKVLLEDVDILCLNKEEMQALVEGDSLEELVRHGHHYCPVVIVSDGPRGVCATDGKTIVRAGTYEDVEVVDRLGAGDAFAAGFLSQWVQGKSLRESIVYGSANSTSVVTKIGAKAGIIQAGKKLHDMPLHITTF